MNVAAAAIATLAWSAAPAVADRYEATMSLRPIGALARVTEDVGVGDGAPVSKPTRGGGGELALTVGVLNWLDLEADAVGAAFEPVTYSRATVAITGTPATGSLVRATRIAQLRAGATLRLGVAWVPTLHLGVGVGARLLSAADLHDVETGRSIDITPDGMDTSMPLDFIAIARVGFEHRWDRHWSVGVSAEATHSIGISTPPLDVVSAGLSFSYSWYPNLW